MSKFYTEAQLDRIAKIERYGLATVGAFDEPDADGNVSIEITRVDHGTAYYVLDANGRLHDHPDIEGDQFDNAEWRAERNALLSMTDEQRMNRRLGHFPEDD